MPGATPQKNAASPRSREFNRGDNFGNAYFQMNQRRGVRWSETKAFLRPVLHRPQLEGADPRARAAHAHRDARRHPKRATGVELQPRSARRDQFVEARREVILAAGSIGSPQILQLSGIGPGALLQQHRPARRSTTCPGVGENLHDHLQVRIDVPGEATCVTLNQRANSLFGKAAMGLEYLLFKTGPLTMPPSQLGAFAKSDPAQPSANIEWHVQPLSLDKFGDPLHAFPAITPSVCNLRPTSRGHVRIKSSDPHAIRRSRSTIFPPTEDAEVAVDAIRFTRRIMQAKALAKYQPEELKPGPTSRPTLS